MPGFAEKVGRQPLPDGVLELIKIAAGCEATLREAAALTGREPEAMRAAAGFYLRHALFFPGAEPDRILGVAAGAGRDERRLHMRWLMIWLHPDHAHDPGQAALAGRVLEAWRQSASGPRPASPSGRPPAAAQTEPPAARGAILRLVGSALLALLAFAALLVCVDPELDFLRPPASADAAAGGFQ